MRIAPEIKPISAKYQKRWPAHHTEWWLRKLIQDDLEGGVYELIEPANDRLWETGDGRAGFEEAGFLEGADVLEEETDFEDMATMLAVMEVLSCASTLCGMGCSPSCTCSFRYLWRHQQKAS